MGKKTSFLVWVASLAFSIVCSPAGAQELWPGDVNNNGIVSAVDLLYLGQAYGSMGAPRANPATDWEAQALPAPWSQSFPNGLNYAYADCNGDGLVDDADLDSGIEDNFGRTHGALIPDGYSNGRPGNAPQIHLSPSATLVQPGAEIDISLSLGDEGFPVASFYGIALLFSYDSELLGDDDGFEFEFAAEGESWVTSPKLEYFFHDDDDNPGKAQIAVTRTNQQPQGPGFGEMGKFSIVIEDIIVGLEIDTFQLKVDSVLLIGEGFTTYAAVPDTATIIIARDSALLGSSSGNSQADVKVYPNPASGAFHIQCDAELTELLLADALGRAVPLDIQRAHGPTYKANACGLLPGLYWLIGRAGDGWFRKKIVIL
ncbi:MAG: hypothetical protein J5I94_29635 [Phaeodactylibacter sp.]|nr:hypothetical protein [Phaeodactylibacter sp.]